MRGLEAKLKLWQGQSLLTQEQADKILSFERSAPQRSWVSYGIASVGIIALITGVISIVASNWDGISDSTKIAGYFLAQALLGLGIWRNRASTGLVREVFITLFALLILAGIGLIGQIFHLESDGWQGLRGWLVLSLPIVLFARSRLINHLWVVGLGTTVAIWLTQSPQYGLDGRSLHDEMTQRVSIAAFCLYVTLALGVMRTERISAWLLDAARMWSLLVLLFPVGIAINIAWAEGAPFEYRFPLSSLAIAVAGVALCVLSLLQSRQPRPRWTSWMLGLVTLSFVGILLPITTDIPKMQLLGLAFFLALWCCAAGAAAEADRKRLFDLATLVISVRLIVAYFELFGSLASTGIGLIITGLVIIGIGTGWNRLRKIFLPREAA